jgi:hypothetical protein
MGAPSDDQIIAFLVTPLADLRRVLSSDDPIVERPFVNKNVSSFLRRFGHGMYRAQQRTFNSDHQSSLPPALHAAESWYVSARRFLRVPGAPTPPRLFTDGFISVRLEIPLLIPRKAGLQQSVKQLAKGLLKQTAEVRSSRAKKRAPARTNLQLAQISKPFREAYLAATIPESMRTALRTGPGANASKAPLLVRSLEPLILLLMPVSVSAGPGLGVRVATVSTGGPPFPRRTYRPRHAPSRSAVVFPAQC